MEITKTLEKEILDYASRKKMLLQGKALDALRWASDFRKVIDSLESDGIFIITEDAARNKYELLCEKARSEAMPRLDIEVEGKSFAPKAREFSPKIKVLKEYDVTGQSCSEGKVSDFLNYFRNKFELLSDMLRKRQALAPKPIKRLKGVAKNEAVDLIGMVYRKWVTKNGHIAFEVEDLEAKCIVLALKDDARLTELAGHVMLDDVLGIKGVKWSEGLIIAKEIIWPDLPMRQPKKADVPLSIASISDIHVGSKLFLEKEFHRFLEWINCRVESGKEREKAGRIKYLMIVGDNVDGIGIYPKQYDELNIRDINKQYEEFSRLIAEIPEYIEIVICPGQHDAVRWADPQPAIPKQFVKELAGLNNIHFVGSPSWLEIEGLKVMLYHGSSLHDLISSVSFLDSVHPEKATVELLKKRDLMPAYGLKQPYVPEKKDFMVIKEEPDLCFFGDMHHNGYDTYRGTTVVHNGTWQGRTAYQIKLGHVPTPGIVPSISLQTRKITETSFFEDGGNPNEIELEY